MSAIEIGLAERADVDGILDLQERNQPAAGGALSASIPRAKIERLIAEMPTIVARRDGRVMGYLIAAKPEAVDDVPVIRAMLAAYAGSPDAYVYGPVCVAAEERGHGLAGAMAEALWRRLPGREAILFIRSDNQPSLKAHFEMGLRRVAEFTYNDAAHLVLSYDGRASAAGGR